MSEKQLWQPNPRQVEALRALKTESERFDPPQDKPNVSAFCREFSPYSASMFCKIIKVLEELDKPLEKRAASYFDEIKKPDALMDDLEQWLTKIPALRLEREVSARQGVHELSKFRAIAVSIKECRNKTGPCRISKYIAPTGGGKTMLRRYLATRLKGELAFHAVESRESWKPANRDQRLQAKRTVLRDFCEALAMRNADWSKGIALVEDQIVDYCTSTVRVLFIDEAEFFSAYALNFIKLLTNKSRLIIVIACTPRAHAKWNTYYSDEAEQISRRTNAAVTVNGDDLSEENLPITLADARLFFARNQFEDSEHSLKFICSQAWTFGHYETIQRVADWLEQKKQTHAGQAQVTAAVNSALKQMGKERAGGGK